ncbi:MAG: hypothetical protein IT479_14095 [Xanthomonadales bacterium]|nr:hypothetical protein [Xanthomonadales bacterium]MCC6594392.1 hypothetical protein [Xanthomonadales bacterium]MCE7932122.1 hybrid sensor histidine kinase/response regulator [Xanthomonadales bacterium PRO6]
MSERDCLLVDDDPVGSAYLAGLLAGQDLRVRHAATLAAARAQLERGLPELLVIDRRLPDGDGLCWLAQELPRWSRRPRCLLCSGDVIDTSALPVGVASLRKPVEAEALLAWLGGAGTGAMSERRAANEPAAQAAPLLDDIAALTRLGDNPEALRSLRRMFATELATGTLRQARDLPSAELAVLLHRVRAGCALTGCARLAVVCAQAESLLAHNGTLDANVARELSTCIVATLAALGN